MVFIEGVRDGRRTDRRLLDRRKPLVGAAARDDAEEEGRRTAALAGASAGSEAPAAHQSLAAKRCSLTGASGGKSHIHKPFSSQAQNVQAG